MVRRISIPWLSPSIETELPQGKIEARQRVKRMVAQMDRENFGHCSNTEACEVECPQQISVLHIGRMNWEYNRAHFE
jgi:succinate dehydrogenase / fumarate reductase, iron-sulfur subunit